MEGEQCMDGKSTNNNENEEILTSNHCPLCGNNLDVDESLIRRKSIYGSVDQSNGDISLSLLQCIHCSKDVMMLNENTWISVSEALRRPGIPDGIHLVKDNADRVILYILSQICYNQYDIERDLDESPFSCHPPKEVAWLLWRNGKAVGFYTIKNKGDLLYDIPYCRYQLVMLDTIYIHQQMRSQGLGTSLVKHYIKQHRGENVGFSAPLSHKLLAVLYKLLLTDVTLRDCLWECSYDGSEGYRRNIWLTYKNVLRTDENTSEQSDIKGNEN